MPEPEEPAVEADEVIIEAKLPSGWAGRIRGRGKQAEGLKKAIDDVGTVGKTILAVLGAPEGPLEKLSKLFNTK